MLTRQQKETFSYFCRHSGDWAVKAASGRDEQVNIIKQRNNYILHIIKQKKATRQVLDVGCGSGELVREIARLGINALGIDFSESMIDIARKRAASEKLKRAEFACCSFFDMKPYANIYDLVSANGFIEYISFEQLKQFLHLIHKSLKKGGSLVLGSRNRIFNLFSQNEFTRSEISSGTVPLLVREAVELSNGTKLSSLAKLKVPPFQKKDEKHKNTGIKVSTRFQYTPAQLIKLAAASSYKICGISPIHIHSLPMKFKEKNPTVHTDISNMLQKHAVDKPEFIPFASTFMLHAQKI